MALTQARKAWVSPSAVDVSASADISGSDADVSILEQALRGGRAKVASQDQHYSNAMPAPQGMHWQATVEKTRRTLAVIHSGSESDGPSIFRSGQISRKKEEPLWWKGITRPS